MRSKIYSLLRYVRAGAAVLVGVLSVAAVMGQFYPVKIFDVQLVALSQRVLVDFSFFAVFLLAGMFLLTFLFGRVYCSVLCPLGLWQEFFMLFSRRKILMQRSHAFKYFLAAVVFGALVGGSAFLVRKIDPYSLFASGMSGAWWGMFVLVFLAVLSIFKGRTFCTNVCPVGAVLGLMSKHALNKVYIEKEKCISCGLCASKCPAGCIDFKNKSVNNETCLKCFKCLSGCPKNSLCYGMKFSEKKNIFKLPFSSVQLLKGGRKKQETAENFTGKEEAAFVKKLLKKKGDFNPARRRFLSEGGAVVLFVAMAKSGIPFGLLGEKKGLLEKKVLLPAGADNPEMFANRCLNCNLCVRSCPMKVLKKANEAFPAVHIDYQDSFCDYDCHKCSQVCPSGAIKRLSLSLKQRVQMGVAEVDKDICVKCGLCVMKCPRQAITKLAGGFPKVDTDMCVGCGACQNGCPVSAIKVRAVERQKLLQKSV